jgi:hypothetical protein
MLLQGCSASRHLIKLRARIAASTPATRARSLRRLRIMAPLLGAILGFGGQMVADFCFWTPPGSHCDSKISCIGAWWNWHDNVQVQAQQYRQARDLLCQFYFLFWLKERGDIAARTMLIAAFIGAASSTIAANYIRRKRSDKPAYKT